MFERGDLNGPSMITMSVYQDPNSAIADLTDRAADGEALKPPANKASDYVRVDPLTTFPTATKPATISIRLDGGITTGVTVRRANQNSAWIFTELDTEIVDGQAMAQTDQGGVFVAGSPINYGLVVGLVASGFVLLLIAIIVAGTIVYFKVRPEKWQSTKASMKKAQMKMKRSFARQV